MTLEKINLGFRGCKRACAESQRSTSVNYCERVILPLDLINSVFLVALPDDFRHSRQLFASLSAFDHHNILAAKLD